MNMTMYSVVVMYFDGEQPVEVADSTDLAPMLQLAGLICQHAIADVSSVEVWEDWIGEVDCTGPIKVVFSWSSEGAIAVQEEDFFSDACQIG
jgi:hypothetical protein